MPYITLLLTLLLLSGCVSSPRTHAPARTDSLQPWLDNTLSPWLTEQLARHPRFKGRTGQLVAMQEHRLQPAIDGLRDEVRQQLFNRLISQPGVQLAWYPDDAPLEHHRSLAQLQCARPRQADFYIGLDIRAGLNGDSHLAIRALEPGASQWMSGFGLQWQGRLTASQQQALQQQRADESLRGLRALPFTGQ
ncbi:MAG: hypothetical protein OIF57_18290, partial [Marinobacterium sp.]|nr:hypothetical protein [Marinobacterium sp.]